MNDDSSKIGKLINNYNDYLDKLKQEEDHSLAIFYDYDIEPLPNDLVDMANDCNEQKLYDDNYITQGQINKINKREK